MKEILEKLTNNYILSKEEARSVLTKLALGEYNHSHMASFLTVFMMRGITVNELSGFKEAMLDLCKSIDLSEFDSDAIIYFQHISFKIKKLRKRNIGSVVYLSPDVAFSSSLILLCTPSRKLSFLLLRLFLIFDACNRKYT